MQDLGLVIQLLIFFIIFLLFIFVIVFHPLMDKNKKQKLKELKKTGRDLNNE